VEKKGRKKEKYSGETMKSAVILILLYFKDVADRIKSKIRYCTRKKESVNLEDKAKEIIQSKQREKNTKYEHMKREINENQKQGVGICLCF
jgi:hypothetical protein